MANIIALGQEFEAALNRWQKLQIRNIEEDLDIPADEESGVSEIAEQILNETATSLAELVVKAKAVVFDWTYANLELAATGDWHGEGYEGYESSSASFIIDFLNVQAPGWLEKYSMMESPPMAA
jgi:hypothetical protein